MINKFYIVIIIAILFAGCGKKPVIIYNNPEMPKTAQFETVWVNPVMIYSDSLYSLIKAERLDSIYIENSNNRMKEKSVKFFIPMSSCFTRINLINAGGDLLYPLFSAQLTMGYYKLTYNSNRIDTSIYKMQDVFIKITYCAKMVTQKLEIAIPSTIENVQ